MEIVSKQTVGVIAYCGECDRKLRAGEIVIQVRVDGILDLRCEPCVTKPERP